MPIFFVLAGMQVKLDDCSPTRQIARRSRRRLTLVAVARQARVGRSRPARVDRWLVGWGMVPRGEVGLIFAFVGKALGVLDDELLRGDRADGRRHHARHAAGARVAVRRHAGPATAPGLTPAKPFATDQH